MIKEKNFSKFSTLLILIPLLIMILNIIIANDLIVKSIWYYIILYLGFGAIIFSGYYLFKYYEKKHFHFSFKELLPIILLILFLIWTFVTTIMSDNLLISLGGTDYRREGFLTYIAYAGFFSVALLTKNEDKNKFYKLFVFVGCLLSIFSIKKTFITNLIVGESTEYNSIFQQFNHFAYFLMMAIICNINLFIQSEKKWLKIIYLLSFILMIKMLIVNNTFGCYLSVLFTLIILGIYYLFINKKRVSYIIILVLFILLSLFSSNGQIMLEYSKNINSLKNIDYNNLNTKEEQEKINLLGTRRGRLWRCTIELIKEKPIIGYGLDNIGMRMKKLGADNDRPHNMILQMCVYTGIPGMILYYLAIIIILIRVLKKIKVIPLYLVTSYSVVIGYLLSSMVANSMYYTSPYYMIFLGFITSILYKKYS